jgi:hypothetical protein
MWYRIKDFYYTLRSWFRHNFCNKNWHKIRKSVNQARPWDYGYWQETLYHYLEYQAAYFEKSQLFVGWEKAVKEIRLCKSLLEIMMEKRELSDYSGIPKIKVYVNTRNASRFLQYKDADYTKYMWQEELYIRKATRLFYRILEEKSRTWWD